MCNKKVSVLSSAVSKDFHELLIVILLINLPVRKKEMDLQCFLVILTSKM